MTLFTIYIKKHYNKNKMAVNISEKVTNVLKKNPK